MSAIPAFPSLGIGEMDMMTALLLTLAVLLWEVLKWLKLIADSLGCNPHRTKQIKKRMKQLGYEHLDLGRSTKLSKAETEKLDEDLTELFQIELFESPAKAGQSIRLIEKVDALTKLLEARLEPPATR